MLKWLKKITLDTQEEYWNSISEFPLYNWIKCNDGNLKYTRLDKNIGTKKIDEKTWVKLYDEYLKEFGLTKRYENYLKLIQKKAILQADFVIKNDKFTLTELEIIDYKIKEVEQYFGEGQSIEVILTWLGQFLGYKINQKETTVKEYYTILEEYGKANKKV